MKLKLCTALFTAATLFSPLFSVAEKAPDAAAAKRAAVAAYGKLPLSFEPTASPSRFLARSGSYAVLIGAGQSSVAVHDAKSGKQQTLRFAFENANPAAQLEAMEPQPGVTNYYVGRDASKWRLGVKSYARLRSAGVYPGVDVVYYGDHRRLEFDYVVAPKADPSAIVLSFSGMDKFSKESNGDLVAEVAGQPVRFAKPYAYQKVDGAARPVEADYELAANGKVHLRLGDYDRNHELIVDPVVSYATYLGGSGADTGNGIAVDSTGAAYVTGQTCSSDFPDGVFVAGSACDAFVTKYNPTGTAIEYTTILGGTDPANAAASGNGIALDLNAADPAYLQAYIVGTTDISDLPGNVGGIANSYLGGDSKVFIAILNANGSLLRSSYLGGTGADAGYGIGVDTAIPPNVSVVGQTCSQDFPAYNAFETKVEDCVAFATKLDNALDIASKRNGVIDPLASPLSPVLVAAPAGGAYYYSSFFGGQPGTFPDAYPAWQAYTNYPFRAIVVDTQNPPHAQLATNAGESGPYYQASSTIALPTPNWNPAPLGLTPDGVCVVTPNTPVLPAICSTATPPVTITWEDLGAVANSPGHFTEAYGVTIDVRGDVIFAGGTDTPSLGSTVWPCHAAGSGAWVYKIAGDAAGCYEVSFESTPTDPTRTIDTARAVATDSEDNYYVVGSSTGTLGGTNGNSYQAANAGGSDAFLFKVSPALAIIYSTYLGGSGNDQALGVAVDGNFEPYVTGLTQSPNFPTINPLVNPNDGDPLSLSGTQGGFITKFTSDGTALVFSSYLGGSGADQSNAIAVSKDTANSNFVDIYVAGSTTSQDFESMLLKQPMAAPNYVPPQTTYGGAGDAFVAMVPGASLPSVTVTPGSLTFSSQNVGTTSAAQAVIYRNTNTLSPVQIESIAFGNSVYKQEVGNGTPPDCGDGSVVQPNSTCQILVTFSPTSTQNPQNSQLTISDDASSTPHVVKLTGTGVLSPVASLSTLSVTFPNQALNVASIPIPVTLTNTGNGPLQFSSIGITGANAGDFGQTNNCGSQLPAGSFCTINVTFTPSALNGRAASLVITDNAANSPQDVVLSGTGISASGTIQLAFVAPATGAFGTQQVGVTSAAQTATLSNISATTALTVNSIAVVPQVTGNTDFAIVSSTGAGACSSTLPFVLAVNASCTIQVTFTPSTAVSESANLTVNGSASNSPLSLALTGTGTGGGSGGGPDFNVTPVNSSGESVIQGGTATYSLQVAPINGYTGTVTFTVTGLATGSSWSVSPNPLNLNGATTQTVTLTVNTSGGSGSSARAVPPQAGARAIFLALLPFSMVGMLFMNKRRGIWLALGLVVLCLLLGMVGCGSGSGSSSGLAAGSYKFTLVGTSTGGAEVQNIPLQLVVNQQ